MARNSGLRELNYMSFNLDRLGSAMSVALALHAAIILGITFSLEFNNRKSQQLEITLAQFNEENNDKADYIADQNQQASGIEDEQALLASPEIAEIQDIEVNQLAEQQQMERAEKSIAQDSEAVFTDNRSATQVSMTTLSEEKEKIDSQDDVTEEQIRGEISSLAAKLDELKEEAAKRPRVRRITSVSTMRAADALYLLKWEQKVERTGNEHYPEEARSQKIFGDLKLLVTVLPNGSVSNIKLLKSSGHRVLDDAAINIVELASPFEPFTPEMTRDIDKLEIERTWHFQKDRLQAKVR